MIFSKPHDLTLTDIAKWVDAYDIQANDNESTLIEYLYYLVCSKARQAGLCNDSETYDDFSIYCVERLFTRLRNTKEEPVKSIVNYIKKVILVWHAEYIRLFCCGTPDAEVDNYNVTDFGDYLVDEASIYDYISYDTYCFKASDIIRRHLRKIPRKKHDPEWSNIYISCMLTLQDRIKSAQDLSNKVISKDPCLLNRVIRSLKTKQPILFHLDEHYAPYIGVLVNEIVHGIAVELTCIVGYHVSVSSCLRNLSAAANSDEED